MCFPKKAFHNATSALWVITYSTVGRTMTYLTCGKSIYIEHTCQCQSQSRWKWVWQPWYRALNPKGRHEVSTKKGVFKYHILNNVWFLSVSVITFSSCPFEKKRLWIEEHCSMLAFGMYGLDMCWEEIKDVFDKRCWRQSYHKGQGIKKIYRWDGYM